jgi:hypothetical protein
MRGLISYFIRLMVDDLKVMLDREICKRTKLFENSGSFGKKKILFCDSSKPNIDNI